MDLKKIKENLFLFLVPAIVVMAFILLMCMDFLLALDACAAYNMTLTDRQVLSSKIECDNIKYSYEFKSECTSWNEWKNCVEWSSFCELTKI